MTKHPLLEVKNLHIEFFDHARPETAVEDFHLLLYPGEVVGIVGESGSGKSMSALAIAGLLNRRGLMKREGEILFAGENLLTCSRKKLRTVQGNEISMIFQEPMTSLNPLLKIGVQVEESLRIHHKELSRGERKKRALSLLEKTGLQDVERIYRMYPHELSGGMRQRVMIAAAMIGEPQILIADEPTTALDVTIQAQILLLLQRIHQKRGTAILFISHDLSLVAQLCERVIVMQRGRIVEEGRTADIFRSPKETYTKNLMEAIPVVNLDD